MNLDSDKPGVWIIHPVWAAHSGINRGEALRVLNMWIRARSRRNESKCEWENYFVSIDVCSLPLLTYGLHYTKNQFFNVTSLSRSLSFCVNEPQNRIALRSRPNWDWSWIRESGELGKGEEEGVTMENDLFALEPEGLCENGSGIPWDTQLHRNSNIHHFGGKWK